MLKLNLNAMIKKTSFDKTNMGNFSEATGYAAVNHVRMSVRRMI